jgi:uncharacterized protein YqeY
MGLEIIINQDIKAAMLAKESGKLEALRAVKAAILLAKTEKGGSDTLSEEVEIKMLQKMVKQRKETAEIYTQNNRPELAEKEVFEAGIIEAYLPKQMSEEQVRATVGAIIAQTGASGMKDMGKVMGIASKQLAGQCAGNVLSGIVKELLG